MMKLLVSLVMLLALASFAGASDVFDEANQNFENGEFKKAVKAYEELLEEGPRVSVLNNLGSAYFRMGDYGQAILAFERALILSSGDRALRANLKLSQEQAAVFPEEQATDWRGVFGSVSSETRAVIALLAALMLPLLAMVRVGSWGLPAGWTLALMLLSLAVLWMALRPMNELVALENRAVILAAPATVRLSPFENAESRGTLSSGHEVVIGELSSGYYWVTANNGTTKGWVHAAEVAPIVPQVDHDPS